MSEKMPAGTEPEEVLIEQDHKKGPGWFLIMSYLVIAIFCFYYLFTFWNWQSDYDDQQKEIQAQIEEQVAK